jgi:hypothetical protein
MPQVKRKKKENEPEQEWLFNSKGLNTLYLLR